MFHGIFLSYSLQAHQLHINTMMMCSAKYHQKTLTISFSKKKRTQTILYIVLPRELKCNVHCCMSFLKTNLLQKMCLKVLQVGKGWHTAITKYLSKMYKLKRFSSKTLFFFLELTKFGIDVLLWLNLLRKFLVNLFKWK